jgi:hypothetical protein
LAVEGTNETSGWATNLAFLFRSEDTHRGFQNNATRTITNLVLNDESLEKKTGSSSLPGTLSVARRRLLLPI